MHGKERYLYLKSFEIRKATNLKQEKQNQKLKTVIFLTLFGKFISDVIKKGTKLQ